jgi:hypothetical protein
MAAERDTLTNVEAKKRYVRQQVSPLPRPSRSRVSLVTAMWMLMGYLAYLGTVVSYAPHHPLAGLLVVFGLVAYPLALLGFSGATADILADRRRARNRARKSYDKWITKIHPGITGPEIPVEDYEIWWPYSGKSIVGDFIGVRRAYFQPSRQGCISAWQMSSRVENDGVVDQESAVEKWRELTKECYEHNREQYLQWVEAEERKRMEASQISPRSSS